MRCHYNPSFTNTYKGTAYRWTIGWATGGGKDLGKNSHEDRPARGDDFLMEIYRQVGDEKIVISSGHGSWLSHFVIDDECVWRIEDPVPQWISYQKPLNSGDERLASDTQNRADMPYIFNRLLEDAETKKIELEEQQRSDKKARVQAQKRRDEYIDSDNPYN